MPFNIRNSDGKFQVDAQGRFYFDDDCCCDTGVSGAFYFCISGETPWGPWDAGDYCCTLSGGIATHDYLWICDDVNAAVGGYDRWWPCYLSGTTGTPVVKNVLQQCGTVPTSCDDLSGWPCSDDFSGTDCNSDPVAGTNWNQRWNDYDTIWTIDTSTSTLSGVAQFGSPGEARINMDLLYFKPTNTTGNIDIKVDYYVVNLAQLAGGFASEISLSVKLRNGGSTVRAYIARRKASSGQHYVEWNGGTQNVTAGEYTASTFQILRESGTTYAKIDTDIFWSSAAYSGWEIEEIYLAVVGVNSTTGDTTQCNFNDFLAEGDDGGEIYLDPSRTTIGNCP